VDPDPTVPFSPDLEPAMLRNDPIRLPPFHFDANPDPAFHFEANPDPAFQFDGDRDPDPAVQNDADPDPLIRGTDPNPPSSSKIVRKTLISTVLWLLYDFLSVKYDVNVLLKEISIKT
jgi:hypothetical protein